MGWVAAAIGIAKFATGWDAVDSRANVEKRRVELEFKSNKEKIRRREFEQEQTQGAATAFSETAGVLHTGGSSAQGFLDTMREQFKLELDWMHEYAQEAKRLGMKSADVEQEAGRISALFSGVQTGASVYGSGK